MALIASFFYFKFEIYDKKVFTKPSSEVLANKYYAFEKWLDETGHPVHIEKRYSSDKFAQIQEPVVMIHASAFDWNKAENYIIPWLEKGGCLNISIDYDKKRINSNLQEFLSVFGVEINEYTDEELDDEDELEDDIDNNSIHNKVDLNLGLSNDPMFDYDYNIFFTVIDNAPVETLDDTNGITRLAAIHAGEGYLFVYGKSLFMYNNNLEKEHNARLAWNITAAHADGGNKGMLIVRDKLISKAFFGRLIEQGNFLPVCISIVLIVVLGFWMVIPVFGLVFTEKQFTSKPIRERFNAEVKFLKKYAALDYYYEIYLREHNTGYKPELHKKYQYRDLINQYRRIFNGTRKI